jgi:hypothetical protein
MPEFDPQLSDSVTLPGGYKVSLKGRKNPLDAYLQDVPLTTPPFVGDRSVRQLAQEPDTTTPRPLPVDMASTASAGGKSLWQLARDADTTAPRTLAKDMGPTDYSATPAAATAAPLVRPDLEADIARSKQRSQSLQDQFSQVGQEGWKGRLARALATFVPVGLAGALGGTYAASGAAQGAAQGAEERLQQQNLMRQSLQKQMEDERQRQAQMEERQLTALTMQRAQDMRERELQETIAGRQAVAETGKKAALPTITVGDRTMQWNPTTQRYDIDIGPMAQPKTEPRSRAMQLKTGTVNGKPTLGNYDPDTGKVFDAAGNDISATFQPREPSETYKEETAQDWLKKHPGKTISDYDIAMRMLGPQTTFNLQTAAAKGGQGALQNVPPHLVPKAVEESSKAGQNYVTAAQAADDMKTFINEARKGNKIAYAYSPVEGVLTLNSGRGIKRVNMPEISSYGGAGSAWDRIQGFFGKQATGASIPPDILNDMEKMHQAVASNAKTAYQRNLQVINKNYGAAFEPVEFEQGAGGGGGTFIKPGGALDKLIKK